MMNEKIATDNGLYFVPLGGTSEIGMNLYLYGVDGAWLMVDFGISFGDDTTPGVEILLPDPSFIEERRDDLVGLVLTHGHEDHFGAIQYLWPRLRCPIYATPFTAAFLRLKLAEAPFAQQVRIVEVPIAGRVDLGPFQIEFVSMTHSIPEPNALVIRSRFGALVHSGDWKLDPEPLVGPETASGTLQSLGEDGVLAFLCDSTNALEPGHSGSEADVGKTLTGLIGAQQHRVVVTCFSTNVARLNSIARAAEANGRSCALIGRSLWRVHEAARGIGYIDTPFPFLTEDEASNLPRDKTVLICTGSQGEPRSALARIAQDDHPRISLDRGDIVVFSARDIPGNEKAIARVQNALSRRGITVITADDTGLDGPVHVSGHPARDELVTLYQWLRPQISVPIHGEPRHLRAHGALAHTLQVPDVVIPEDGALMRLAPGRPEIVDHVPTGRLARDGKRLIRLEGAALKSRNRMVQNGAAVVTVILDADDELAVHPQVSLLGLEDADALADTQEFVADEVRAAVEGLSRSRRGDDDTVRETARVSVRRSLKASSGKRPLTEIHLVRL